MDGLLLALAILACPVGMGLMMVLMMRGQRRGMHGGHSAVSPSEQELIDLRAEVERLKAERAQRQRTPGEV